MRMKAKKELVEWKETEDTRMKLENTRHQG